MMSRACRQSIAPAAVLLCGLALCVSAPLRAQGPLRLDGGGALEVGGEAERYLRALQLAGVAAPQSWTIRPVAPRWLRGAIADSVHPWQSRWVTDTTRSFIRARFLRPSVRVTWNSAVPSGDERGPVWTGRGVTADARFGFSAQLWRVHLQVAPVLFRAQNQAFALAPNGRRENGAFADPRFPWNIDAPQAFGVGAYQRIDAGNSTLSLDLPLLSVGLSTAAQSWGPGREYPLLLGGNAGGFPHVFLGTPSPVPVGIGAVHLRVIGGQLTQSAWSPMPADQAIRTATAGVFVFLPRGLTGLEVGASRFIHGISERTWPGTSAFRRLVSGGLSGTGELNQRLENQMASLFFRWQFSGARLVLFGEMFRDDYSLDRRRLIQYPDDLRTSMLGLERVLSSSATHLHTLHAELVNGELPSSNRGERGSGAERGFLSPLPPYLHGAVRQGHTQNGLILASPVAYGGAGWRVGFDRFTTRGRRSLLAERMMRLDWRADVRGDSLVRRDIRYAVTGEMLQFVGGREVSGTVSAMMDLNRNLVPGNDVFNLRAAVSVRGWR